jgi:predicted nucleotidyltransferase
MNVFRRTLDALAEAGVDFVIIGGVAATAHGSARVTFDLDICYERSRANLERLSLALRPYHPRLRDAPAHLPFDLDAATIRHGMNFSLTTDLGDIDVLGEIAGIGQYTDVLALSDSLYLLGRTYRVLSLEGLIRSKRTAGRSKDLEALRELEALLEIAAKTKGDPGGRTRA